MWLILLEAAAAGLLLIGIIWWTMFAGRSRGERVDDPGDTQPPKGDDPPR